MARYTLTVNGAQREVDVELDTPLLYVLRDALGLNGPKFGCGLAQCGACTVHVDGEETRPAFRPSAAAEGDVTTLEGLGTTGTCTRCRRPSSTSRRCNAATASTA